MKRKTIIIAIVIVAVVFVIGFGLRVGLSRKTKTEAAGEQAIVVEVVVSKKHDIGKTNELIGTIEADKTAQVFPETMGRVTKILVKDGSRVAKGDNLMTLRNETVGFEFEEAAVTAPITGSIASVMVDVGSMVSPQVPVAVVVDFSRIKVVFNVAEVDAGFIKRNNRIKTRVDALPDKTFEGIISEVSPVVDPMTRTIAVKADIANASGNLKPGMTARIFLDLGIRKDVLALPKDALMDHVIFVVGGDSTAERREVTTGLIGDEWAEITGGLQENELVVVIGQQRLAGGEKLRAIVRDK
jgi:multidrug efflux pump subunit AcrA (membrane-fusion protein)